VTCEADTWCRREREINQAPRRLKKSAEKYVHIGLESAPIKLTLRACTRVKIVHLNECLPIPGYSRGVFLRKESGSFFNTPVGNCTEIAGVSFSQCFFFTSHDHHHHHHQLLPFLFLCLSLFSPPLSTLSVCLSLWNPGCILLARP